MKLRSRNILITGVSTGIGYAIAKEFIARGYNVFGSVRKTEDGERLTRELGAQFCALIFDVTDQQQVDQAAKELKSRIGEEGLACLINNSGIAIGGPIQHQDMSEIQYHFEVNVFGLLRVTKAFLPLLGASNDCRWSPGKILNISSVGGKFAQPFVAAYVGTKHAVEGISQSLRRELLLYGIDVIIIGPGVVRTPIWDKGIQMDKYENTEYGRILKKFAKAARNGIESGLDASDLGRGVVDIFEKEHPKTRYTFVANWFKHWIVPRLLPDRLVDKFIKKSLKID